MTFVEKHKNLIAKLAETDYGVFCGDKEKALSFVANNFELIADYINTMIRRQIMKPIWNECDEKTSFESKQEKAAYGYALIGAKRLNSLAQTIGSEPLFIVDRTGLRNNFGEYVFHTLVSE